MKTLHVLILAGSILGASWILKPVPLEQVSQAELQRREELERLIQERSLDAKLRNCAASLGKTVETLDRDDPKQATAFDKCVWPEESRGPIRRMWDKICGLR
ncbi:MAG: hypothetical protein Q7W02_10755 [Candidatus Rokubacteria bacterium]|nr:hypothetical protein [Candidatus Rokubacteria bacterium]